MRSSAEQQVLLQLAKTFRLTAYEEAFGRCFAAALSLADSASKNGIAVELVRWQVVGDQDFCDHWAITFGDAMVIDPTRVQVDGRTELLQPMSSYPRHYRNPRRYPAALLLSRFAQLDMAHQEHMSLRFMWGSGIALVRYDMSDAYRAREWGKLHRAMQEMVQVVWRTALGALQHRWIRPPQNRVGTWS